MATQELLTEQGFEATTLQRIAARAGVAPSAIYRRWPSRIDVIEAAVFPGLAMAPISATGNLARDLHEFLRVWAAALGSPVARAAMPGLLASYQSAQRAAAVPERHPLSFRPDFLEVLRAAPQGSVDPAVDPEDVFDVLLGALLARSLVPTVMRRGRPLDSLVRLAIKMLAAPHSCEAATC